MSITPCHRRMKEGVMDQSQIEFRLDQIESRIDDLCGLLGEVLERVGHEAVSFNDHPDLELFRDEL